MVELIGWIAAGLAITGVVLNNYRLRLCFVLWLGSNAASCGLHLAASMWALSVRDAVFFCLAIHGLIVWGRRAVRP